MEKMDTSSDQNWSNWSGKCILTQPLSSKVKFDVKAWKDAKKQSVDMAAVSWLGLIESMSMFKSKSEKFQEGFQMQKKARRWQDRCETNWEENQDVSFEKWKWKSESVLIFAKKAKRWHDRCELFGACRRTEEYSWAPCSRHQGCTIWWILVADTSSSTFYSSSTSSSTFYSSSTTSSTFYSLSTTSSTFYSSSTTSTTSKQTPQPTPSTTS